jgi:hypothetical protein
VLKILKGGDRISQILNDSFANVGLDTMTYDEQAHRSEACGDQQHGEQKARAQPGSVHECGSGLSWKSLRRGF